MKGHVSNPYDKKIYGVGYIGVGEYKPSNNKKMTKSYIRWSNMMRRCYSSAYKNLHKTYKFRGGYPIGVVNHLGKYEVKCGCGDGSGKYLGRYKNIDDAFNTYKMFKENTIATQAEKYKKYLSINAYNALLHYTVEIND